MFTRAINHLQKGETVKITPRGNSMRGKINSGDLVTLEPCNIDNLSVGDVVLVKVKGRVYLHLIKAIKKEKNGLKFQIGNNVGGINGWAGGSSIYGVVSKIEKGNVI